jgi:hypothetical protein
VNTEDQVVALFAKANPVPSLDLLDPIEKVDIDRLTSDTERRRAMTEVKTTREDVAVPRRRLVPVLLAVLGVIVATAIILGQLNRPTEPVQPTPTEAEVIATAYYEAGANQDLSAIEELAASDADVPIEPSELSGRWAYERATGWVFPPAGCEERSTGPDGTLVACRYMVDGAWMQALGLEPEVGIDLVLVEDGRIQSVTEESGGGDNVGEAWSAFRSWVVANHNDDMSTMYESNGLPRYTPEAVALWEQYTDEFVAEMGG